MAEPRAHSAQVARRPGKGPDRDQLIRLAAADRPWAFLPHALDALASNPDDEVRLAAAANFARLGLATLAGRQLDLLSDPSPAADRLRAALDRLPDDRLSLDQRIANARRNALCLRSRAQGLDDALDRWLGRARTEECFVAHDGNVVRRRSDDPPERFTALADQRAAADPRRLNPAAWPEGAPITLEGLDPPWLFQRLAAPSCDAPWSRAALLVVQADLTEALDGLSLTDLRAALADPRTECFLGPDAADQLASFLRHRTALELHGPILRLTTLRTPTHPSIERIADESLRAQAGEQRRLTEVVAARYAPLDRAHWRARFHLQATSEPLRVLIPASRRTTYVRFACEDLARAFDRAGWRAELLTEPDDHSRLSSVAWLRAIEAFSPDLIVLVNYTRRQAASAVPDNLPFVCWVQDTMGHLFDPAMGVAQSDLDFLIGHLPPELFESFGYPAARAASFPVVACAQKFHAAPVAPSLRRRYACEVSYVSHQSEPAETLRDRFTSRLTPSDPLRDAAWTLFDAVRERVERCADVPPHGAVRDATRAALAAAYSREPSERALRVLLHQYALPLADRMIRRQTIEWAAQICERRSWTLRLFGRGWDADPRLSSHAAGEIHHGEDLRAVYQASAVSLHMSVNSLVHQRVVECALSAGLPVCRLHADELFHTASHLAALVRADTSSAGPHDVADHPELLRWSSLCARLRVPPVISGLEGHRFEPHRGHFDSAERTPIQREHQADWLLADLPSTTFRSEDELEALLERAVDRPAWREAMSSAIAARARAALTHDALVHRIECLLRAGVSA